MASNLPSMFIKLKRVDRIYNPGETVSGVLVVTSKGSLSHNGIQLMLDGQVTLQLSAKSVGLFEAFYNSLKPVSLAKYIIEVAGPGKLPDGVTELPFEFPLEATDSSALQETYHGVFVNIQYMLIADMPRPLLAKNLHAELEFIVEIPSERKDFKESPVEFTITPESLENIKASVVTSIPRFRVSGKLNSAVCPISQPFNGELVIEECEAMIKSIELQLVRIETCGSAEGYAKEATEIQNIQVAEGDVCKNMVIPLYMVFPRLFTCPTVATRSYQIGFEVNLVVCLMDGHLVTENFPIKLFRM